MPVFAVPNQDIEQDRSGQVADLSQSLGDPFAGDPNTPSSSAAMVGPADTPNTAVPGGGQCGACGSSTPVQDTKSPAPNPPSWDNLALAGSYAQNLGDPFAGLPDLQPKTDPSTNYTQALGDPFANLPGLTATATPPQQRTASTAGCGPSVVRPVPPPVATQPLSYGTPLVPVAAQPAEAAGASPSDSTTAGASPAVAPGGLVPAGSPDEVTQYVTQAASNRGIDPAEALGVVNGEGGTDPNGWARPGDAGSSFGPFQLHRGGIAGGGNAVGGLGDAFAQQTGLDPSDPATWKQQVDFSLDYAAQHGWGPWHGDPAVALGPMHGIGPDAHPIGITPSTPALCTGGMGQPGGPIGGSQGAPTGGSAAFGDNLVPDQFNVGLSPTEAYAACGPVAAIAFARANGRDPNINEAMQLAQSVGWTSGSGMAGPASEKALLDKMGVPSVLQTGASWPDVQQNTTAGLPVILSTPGHYFVADGYDSNSGAYHVGHSGTAYRGGATWLTPAQMQSLGGQVQATLFLAH